jgi:hypothetical protein
MNETMSHQEIAEAIFQFRTQPHERREAAKKLLPLLKTETPRPEVEAMLGTPDARVWDYTLFYSSTLIIHFDNEGKVIRVSSDLLDEVRKTEIRDRDKTDPEIVGAILEFRQQPYNRQKPARRLLPLIQVGMTIAQVETILGPPDGTRWDYSLSQSSSASLSVRFSNEGKLEKASATGLGEE